MTLAEFGQLGDVFGGVATVAQVGLIVWAAWKVVPSEIAKFRQQKQLEILALVARDVWSGTHRLDLALRSFCSPFLHGASPDDPDLTRGQTFHRDQQPRQVALGEAGNEFVEVWGLADMYFPADVGNALKALWELRAEILAAATMYAMDLDSPGVAPDAYARVFAPATQRDIERAVEAIKAALRSHAHVGVVAKA